ncbi:unnamed protein product [Didymodactylos carnosus]|uniref:Uncharacterized protein n=1 Tax=Didymodactylos carnosus TaxID=1234261 RepID=A0A813V1R2_9BILA|nr:unnamed protein product [Didymodactylos carnosus]CAF3622642.1 unnamed protein product [Didymodactylos carnosus]
MKEKPKTGLSAPSKDLNLKEEILLENYSVTEDNNKNNVIEQIMENVNKKYDNLTVKAKYLLHNLTQIKDHVQQFETQLSVCYNFIEKIYGNVRVIVVDKQLLRQNVTQEQQLQNDVEIQRQEIRNLESYMLPLRQRLSSKERLLKQIELKFDDVKRKLLKKQEQGNDIGIKLNQFGIWLNEQILDYD